MTTKELVESLAGYRELFKSRELTPLPSVLLKEIIKKLEEIEELEATIESLKRSDAFRSCWFD